MAYERRGSEIYIYSIYFISRQKHGSASISL